MPLSENVQIALSLLQTIGLLIPVVFLALRSYFPDKLTQESEKPGSQAVKIREAPRPIQIGYWVVGLFALSGVSAGVVVLHSLNDSWVLSIATASLMFGFAALLYLFYLLQDQLSLKAV